MRFRLRTCSPMTLPLKARQRKASKEKMLMKPQKRPLKGKIPYKKVAIAFIELVVKVQNSSTAAAMMTRKESSEKPKSVSSCKTFLSVQSAYNCLTFSNTEIRQKRIG